jgi:3-oxoacyl-[acyl-carrier protein] reductase
MNILITGGASGLGEAITRKLAFTNTHKIIFTYFHSFEKAEAIEREFKNTKGIQCDFKNEKSIEQLIRQMDGMSLNGLVHNAITGYETNHFHKTPSESFAKSFIENIIPIIKITQKAISTFRKERHGKIITILSSALINTPPLGMSEYVASKAYLESLSKSWAIENASLGITSNCISPSFMQTHLNHKLDERVLENMIASHPLKKILTVEEVADVVAFFIDATPQINGVNLVMNAAENIE